jgi:hypothetical protein
MKLGMKRPKMPYQLSSSWHAQLLNRVLRAYGNRLMISSLISGRPQRAMKKLLLASLTLALMLSSLAWPVALILPLLAFTKFWFVNKKIMDRKTSAALAGKVSWSGCTTKLPAWKTSQAVNELRTMNRSKTRTSTSSATAPSASCGSSETSYSRSVKRGSWTASARQPWPSSSTPHGEGGAVQKKS